MSKIYTDILVPSHARNLRFRHH